MPHRIIFRRPARKTIALWLLLTWRLTALLSRPDPSNLRPPRAKILFMEDSSQKTRIYILLGPTAAGKSAIALELADRAGAEIISIDSMQVYRGMDVGTAKPTAADRARVPHHLVDLREPWESFSTAEYVRLADAAIGDVSGRGRIPLFVGGTALYVKSLLLGIFEGPSADWRFRGELRREAAEGGAEALHARLAGVVPEAARRIHPTTSAASSAPSRYITRPAPGQATSGASGPKASPATMPG